MEWLVHRWLPSFCGECQHQWIGPGIVDGKLKCPRCGAVWEPETGKVTPGRPSTETKETEK
jgi:hypothetical protein